MPRGFPLAFFGPYPWAAFWGIWHLRRRLRRYQAYYDWRLRKS